MILRFKVVEMNIFPCNSYHLINQWTYFSGSVKDSVVGEERIAQYLLAVLNTRGTPLHWRRSMNEKTEGHHLGFEDKPDYSLKNLLPNRKIQPNDKSDVVYIEVSARE